MLVCDLQDQRSRNSNTRYRFNSTLGMMLLASASDLIALYLGLEL